MPNNVFNVAFVGLGANDKAPPTALYSLDANGAPVAKLASVDNGKLSLDSDKLKGLQVAVGPDVDDPKTLDPKSLLRFRADQVIADWQRIGLQIPKDRWPIFLGELVCVSGHVKKCRPWWWDLVIANPVVTKLGVQRRLLPGSLTDLSASATLRIPYSCQPVCDGIVEIFERDCCCPVIDWWDLVGKLRDVLKQIPAEINWPVPPIPDPGPLAGTIRTIGSIRLNPGLAAGLRTVATATVAAGPALRPRAVDFTQTTPSARLYDDYRALLKTPHDQVTAFVDARPYLSAYCCTCTTRKVGEVAIRPGGDFDFCYRRIPHIVSLRTRCYSTFAYRVRQQIGGAWVTIYDGIAGHDYFAQGDVAELHTTNPAARSCADSPPPPDTGDGQPFVMLEYVTGTQTHHFNFPAQNGNSQFPAFGMTNPNAGLYNFGTQIDCPWATSLGLRLWFSPSLAGTVVYYRLKAVPTDTSGHATGAPVVLDTPVAWQRFVGVGDTEWTPLAAPTAEVGGLTGLFRVPYWDAAHQWLSGQYHQVWNTAAAGSVIENARYMLVLEVFGPGGAPITPASAGPGAPTARAFQFRRWDSASHTANVPHDDCAHLFWINNRPVSGDIHDLRLGGVANTEECQFMASHASDTVSIGFRAYHVDGLTTGGGPGDTDSFMAGYSISWQRGLNGPTGYFETGVHDKGEAGPVASNALSLGFLLGPGPFPPSTTPVASHTRCTFSVHLAVDAKHHNGGAFIDAYDYHETASFALEITP